MKTAIEGGKTKFSHDYDTETFSPEVCRSANRSSSLPATATTAWGSGCPSPQVIKNKPGRAARRAAKRSKPKEESIFVISLLASVSFNTSNLNYVMGSLWKNK